MGNDRCEVEDSNHPVFDEVIDDFLGDGGRHGDDGHADVVFLDEITDAIHAVHGDLGGLVAGTDGIEIEGGEDLEAFLFEAAILEEGGAEIADADEDHGLESAGAEEIADHLGELIDIVTEAAGAELAEVGEVLAELGGFDAGGAGEGFAADGLYFVFLETLQAAQVDAETIDRLAGDFGSAALLQTMAKLGMIGTRRQAGRQPPIRMSVGHPDSGLTGIRLGWSGGDRESHCQANHGLG